MLGHLFPNGWLKGNKKKMSQMIELAKRILGKCSRNQRHLEAIGESDRPLAQVTATLPDIKMVPRK